MANLRVSEYKRIGNDKVPVPSGFIAAQTLDFSGGVDTSTAFNADTNLIRIEPQDVDCYVLYGAAPGTPDATSEKFYVNDSKEAFREVQPGWVLKVVGV